MVCKLFKSGDSTMLTLPKAMLDTLHLKEGDDVSVELDVERRQIVITRPPAEAEGVDVEYARQVAEFIDAYRPALEALATP